MKWLPFLALPLMAAPAETSFRMPSGLPVHLEERHDKPLLRLELRVGWDPRLLEAHPNAVPELARALREGSVAGMSARNFARALSESGIQMKLRCGEGFLGISMLSDSRSQEAVFEHLAHVLIRASLDADTANLGPKGGHGLAPGESALSLDEKTALYRHLLRPERAVLVIQGDLDPQQARNLVLQGLGTWAPAPQTLPVLPLLKPAGDIRIPLPPLDPRKRAAHLLLSYLVQREAEKAGVIVDAKREDGQPGSISMPPASLGWASALCQRGFSARDLAQARQALEAERITRPLHPEAQLAHRAQAILTGDPGLYLADVSLDELNAVLRERMGAIGKK